MIIKAETCHLKDILEIERLSFDQPWSEYHFMRDLTNNDLSYNWVAVVDETTVGFLFGWMLKNEYHLNNIAVHPDFRGNRIGRELLNTAINSISSRKTEKILLEVRADNHAAIRLYRSVGFQEVGIRKDYYKKGIDAILYTLELTSYG